MTPISKELYAVLVAWREDAMSDAPSIHARSVGLCNMASRQNKRAHAELKIVLQLEFGDHFATPFNTDDDTYHDRWSAGTQHLNPLRRAWVDAKIAEYEAAHTGEVAGS